MSLSEKFNDMSLSENFVEFNLFQVSNIYELDLLYKELYVILSKGYEIKIQACAMLKDDQPTTEELLNEVVHECDSQLL